MSETIQTCLGRCTRYGIGSAAYALCTSRCYAAHKAGRVAVDNNKVTFWTQITWKKVSHDLLKYLMESGKCTAHCAKQAEAAFMSTGWERTSNVTDVADTVYNIVTAKRLCSPETAILGREWVNANLNTRLRAYIRNEELEPENIGYQPGAAAAAGAAAAEGAKAVKEKIGDIELPSIPMPNLGVLKIFVVIFVLIFALIALGYSGLGGVIGSEHKRYREKD